MKIDGRDPTLYAELLRSPARPTMPARPNLLREARARGDDRIDLGSEAILRKAQEALETEIGKKISEAFEKAGIKLPEAMGMDWTPTATAKRIFDFTTGLIGIYRQQNPHLDDEELVDRFERTIRGAVDRGYGEAMRILGGMGIDELARPTAEETMRTLHALFDEHFANLRAGLSPKEDARKPSRP